MTKYLTIQGQQVPLEDSQYDKFIKLSPEEQNSTVDEIAKSLPKQESDRTFLGSLKEGAQTLPGQIGGVVSDVGGRALTAASDPHTWLNFDPAPPPMQQIQSGIDTVRGLGDIAGKGIDVAQGLNQISMGNRNGPDVQSAYEASKPVAAKLGQYVPGKPLNEKIATDPLGVLTDASLLATAGGEIVPGIVGKILAGIGNATNPAYLPVKGLKAIGAATLVPMSAGTGAGVNTLKEAYHAGTEGLLSPESSAFYKNMRGTGGESDILKQARGIPPEMAKARGVEYNKGMANIITNPSNVDMRPIVKQFTNLKDSLYVNGVPKVEPAAIDKLNKAGQYVLDTMNASKTGRISALEADALKQRINTLMPSLSEKTGQQGRVIEGMYKIVHDEIVNQVPEYKAVMDAYSKSKIQQKDLTKVLGLGENTSSDVAMKKLQGAISNTSLGTATEKLNELVDMFKNTTLKPALAGRLLSSMEPRGGYVGQSLLRLLPPRVVGEAVHGAGIIKRILGGPDTARRLLYGLGIEQATNPNGLKGR